jgi:hypothetical protein
MDVGKPIRIFYANMLKIGIIISLKNGKLIVEDQQSVLTPVLQDEIVKRAQHLIDFLSPYTPEELKPYCYKLLTIAQLKEALTIANERSLGLKQTPVNGGWLLEPTNPVQTSHKPYTKPAQSTLKQHKLI